MLSRITALEIFCWVFQGGCIPHLTHDVMQMLSSKSMPLQFPLSNIYRAVDAIERSDMSLDSFVGLPVSTILRDNHIIFY